MKRLGPLAFCGRYSTHSTRGVVTSVMYIAQESSGAISMTGCFIPCLYSTANVSPTDNLRNHSHFTCTSCPQKLQLSELLLQWHTEVNPNKNSPLYYYYTCLIVVLWFKFCFCLSITAVTPIGSDSGRAPLITFSLNSNHCHRARADQ